MALDVEVGTFDKVTSPTTSQNVSVSFDPKALFIWGVKNATANSDASDYNSGSIGFSDGANDACTFWQNQNAAANVDAKRRISDGSVLEFFSNGTTTIDVVATVSFGTGQFTMSYSTNDSNASKIHYIVWGGSDITGVQVGTFTKPTGAAPVTQNIPTDADVRGINDNEGVVIFDINFPNALNATQNNFQPTLGFATSTSQQGYVGWSEDDQNATAEPRQTLKTNRIGARFSGVSGDLQAEANFNGFLDDGTNGFSLIWDPNNSIASYNIFLIIKGGQWQAGNETMRTTTGTKQTTTSFQPKAAFFLCEALTVAKAPTQEDMSMIIGASDNTTEASGGMSDEDANTTTNIGKMSSITKSVRVMNAVNQAVLAEADVSAFNATNFELNYTVADSGNAYLFNWLVCGDAAAAPARRRFPQKPANLRY